MTNLTNSDFDRAFERTAGLESIKFEMFYRLFGARTFSHFTSPRFGGLEDFELPLESVVHYLPHGNADLGISKSHLFLQKSAGYLLINHVDKLVEDEFPVRNAPVNKATLEQKYRKRNRGIRPIKNYVTAIRDKRAIIIENYSLISHLYLYPQQLMSRYHKWLHLAGSLVENLNNVVAETNREQWIELRIPKHIPARNALIQAEKRLTKDTLSLLPDQHTLMIWELWKWLGDNRENSVFSKLTKEAIDKIQFVFVEGGKFTLLSMGSLDAWRASDDSEGGATQAPKQMQRYFLSYLDQVFAVRSVSAKTTITPTEIVTADGTVTSIVVGENEIGELVELEEGDEGYPTTDTVTYVNDAEENDLIEPDEDELPEHSHHAIEKAQALFDKGLISEREMNRYRKLSTKYASIPNPWGEGTLEDLCKVNPEVLNDLPEEFIPDIPSVLDKSLLKSSLVHFDKNYITKVMESDVASMFVNLTKAGYIIHDFKVEIEADANSEVKVYKVRVEPIGGQPSTLVIPMPLVNEEGIFRSAGVNYRMRKQFADLPIRKVGSGRVGLTSYYSKMFVSRSIHRVHDYGAWLKRELVLAVLATDSKVTNVVYGNTFDKSLPTPKTFATLSTVYKSFTIGEYDFNFNLDELRESLGDSFPGKSVTATGAVYCGLAKNGTALYMQQDGDIIRQDDSSSIGSIEELLDLSLAKAPVEPAVIKVSGKLVPIGFILAYYRCLKNEGGLTALIDSLGAEVRHVTAGARLEMTADEYAIRFADRSLVLNRKDGYTALILSGFNILKKAIKRYDYDEFNSTDVYAAVLEDAEFGVRILKQLDMLDPLWVDPITRGILEERNEPTEYPAILEFATKMLLTNDYPDEGSGKHRRVRGYERMTGHLYKQLMDSVRQQRSAPASHKAPLSIKRYDVFTAIRSDASVGIVNEINPVEYLKEMELITHSGTGGRSSRTMVKRTRGYHPDDLGTVSEGTVDNSNVAVTVFTPPNPKFKDLRGLRKDWDVTDKETSSIFSTTGQLSACHAHDD